MKYTYEVKKEVVKRYLEDKQLAKKIFTDMKLDVSKYTYTYAWAKKVSDYQGYEVLQQGKIIANKTSNEKKLVKIKILEAENKKLRKENQSLNLNTEFIKKAHIIMFEARKEQGIANNDLQTTLNIRKLSQKNKLESKKLYLQFKDEIKQKIILKYLPISKPTLSKLKKQQNNK